MNNFGTLVVGLAVVAAGVPALGATAPGPAKATQPVPPYAVARGAGKGNVTLNVDRAPVQSVLALLFRRNNQSYVLGSRVAGTVTASLNDVPFNAALDQVLTANSVPLVKTMQGTVYVIKSRERPQSPAAQPVGRGRYRNSRSFRSFRNR